MNQAKIISIRLLFLFIGIAFFTKGCENKTFAPIPTPVVTPREVIHNSMNLRELWRRPTLIMPYVMDEPFLLVLDDQLIYSEYYMTSKTTDQSWLVALNLETGDEVWRTELQNPGFGTSFQSFLLDQETKRLFIEYSFRIHAFDMVTGRKLWSTNDLGGHTGYSFWPGFLNPLKIDTTKHETILIDPNTGVVLDRQSYDAPKDFYYLLVENDGVRFAASQEWLRAIDLKNNEVLWEYSSRQPANRQLINWPKFTDNDMIYQTGGPTYIIRRVDLRSGNVIWETNREYISNMIFMDNFVYGIQETGRLVALDSQTGGIVGQIEFNRTPSKIGSRPYMIGMKEPYFIIAWGDEPEITVFKER